MKIDSPRIETQRLILRPPVAEDFDAYARFMGDEIAARFIGGIQSRPVAWRSFTSMAGSWVILGFGMFSVIERSSGKWTGRVGPVAHEGWPGTEIGYAMAREFWGKGYATESAVATMDWAFSALGWTDIIHSIDPANTASQAVARRLGAMNRGPGKLPAPFEDAKVDIWGQTEEEWKKRRAEHR